MVASQWTREPEESGKAEMPGVGDVMRVISSCCSLRDMLVWRVN